MELLLILVQIPLIDLNLFFPKRHRFGFRFVFRLEREEEEKNQRKIIQLFEIFYPKFGKREKFH